MDINIQKKTKEENKEDNNNEITLPPDTNRFDTRTSPGDDTLLKL